VLSTGSPLAPESFDWVYREVKRDLLLGSISGGTDIISCFCLGVPWLPVRAGELQGPGLGMDVQVWNERGEHLQGSAGELVCAQPFPSMPVGFWNDAEGRRYRAAYFERFPGVWHHGDRVVETASHGFVFLGRSDAVLNPGGVRIGTAEIYRQLDAFPEIAEAVAVGQTVRDAAGNTDERVLLFLRLQDGADSDHDALFDRVRRRLRDNASPRHVPARIVVVPDIPRTRSGKTVELAVKHVVNGQPVDNVEALANPEALRHFQDLPHLLA
jgi:acetoacetyl-CoA synthetase